MITKIVVELYQFERKKKYVEELQDTDESHATSDEDYSAQTTSVAVMASYNDPTTSVAAIASNPTKRGIKIHEAACRKKKIFKNSLFTCGI